MKILQLIQKPQLRGAEIFACQLSNHLLDLGHEVMIISLLPGDAKVPFKGRLIRLDRSLGKRFIDLSGWSQLAHYIEEFEPDLVQANAGDTLKFAVLSKLLFRWKSPIYFRNANKVSEFINSWPKWIFNRFLMSHVSHVISVSESCRQDFISTYSFIPRKTTMVPVGIERESVNKALPDDLKSIFKGGKVLVHVGSFVPEKNHFGALRIVQRLLEKGEDVKLVFIGDGRLRPIVEQEINDKKLLDHIFILGYRTDVLSVMANAHAFILPSKVEGLPGVILEAMYCRTPVVAYDVGGISEVVKDGETGWLVKAGDETGFAAAIEELLDNPNLDTIKENAYNLVVNEYANLAIARRFLEAYPNVNLKIIHLIQKPQLRGAEIFACQLSNHLADNLQEVHIISLLSGDARLPFKGKFIPLNRPQNRRFIDLVGWKQLSDHIKEFKPDIVQANAGDTLKFAVLSKFFFGWKSRIVFRNASKVSEFIDSWPKLVFNKFLMRYVSHVISVSELCRQDFIKTYSFSPHDTTMIPIGIELEPVNTSLPADLDSIFADAKVLVHVGSFGPEKNHLGLIRIAEKLLQAGINLKFVLIGDGELRQLIEVQVKEKKLSDRIFLLGYRRDVLSIVANADAFILPSKIEGLPGVILEAMYCRIPVVAYDVGGISEVVRQGETGWLVRAGDEDGFVRAIEDLLESRDLDAIRENAYNTVVMEHNNSAIARRFLDAYRRII